MTAETTGQPELDRAPRARLVLAGVTALHGVAHFAGTAGHLGRIDDGESERYLGGAWEIGDPAALRALAATWAAIGAAVVLGAVLVALWRPSARIVFPTVIAASLVLSTLALWSAIVGLVVDIALLGAVAAAPGLLPRRR